ncbi:hypothetical protein FPQ10_06195 [Allobacillus sp. SKP2-8]|uniref:hypothetical protein n=1 Tax=unclassified Allobacillus TaxID=2628859 RepID=UPI00118213AE|nr:hypothetical protein [Allobacillus sp. SKP2-8]TSJ67381.1 hypothetical protein FPQ10_06195 [Allobacillus sp. SKP2-8]
MISRQSNIYILAPRNIITGGTESLHQLAFNLKKLHPNVFIHYIDSQDVTPPVKFEKYKVPISKDIIDSEENLLIVSETNTEYLKKYKNIKGCIWWLSLDYYIRQLPQNAPYYFCEKHKIPLIFESLIEKLLHISGRINTNIFSFNENNRSVFHFYNCEYVRLYLTEQGVCNENMMYLCGPIGDEYFEHKPINKKNIIAYNPAKGFEYTRQVIKAVERKGLDVQFTPIKNLDANGVINLLSQAKLYIDFGYFPGPERIPREAVTLRTNLLTSLSGSAKNDIDVPIPRDYKFDLDYLDENLDKIVDKINELTLDYDTHLSKFDNYRKKVVDQKETFHTNLKTFYNNVIR